MVLNRLDAERRQTKESAARRAHLDRQYAWKHDVNFTRALCDSMDRFLGDPKAMAAAFTGAPKGEAPLGEAPSAPAPEAPGQSPEQAPLSRQQRRALERREKKQARRAATAEAA